MQLINFIQAFNTIQCTIMVPFEQHTYVLHEHMLQDSMKYLPFVIHLPRHQNRWHSDNLAKNFNYQPSSHQLISAEEKKSDLLMHSAYHLWLSHYRDKLSQPIYHFHVNSLVQVTSTSCEN